jgi:hypothetical protein
VREDGGAAHAEHGVVSAEWVGEGVAPLTRDGRTLRSGPPDHQGDPSGRGVAPGAVPNGRRVAPPGTSAKTGEAASLAYQYGSCAGNAGEAASLGYCAKKVRSIFR